MHMVQRTHFWSSATCSWFRESGSEVLLLYMHMIQRTQCWGFGWWQEDRSGDVYDAVGRLKAFFSLQFVQKVEIKVLRLTEEEEEEALCFSTAVHCWLTHHTHLCFSLHYSSTEQETNRSCQHFIPTLPDRRSAARAGNEVWQGIAGVPGDMFTWRWITAHWANQHTHQLLILTEQNSHFIWLQYNNLM